MLFPDTPFQSLALALSGGGFRAAAYGLGVLSLLNKIRVLQSDGSTQPLLEQVHFVSSASGGTITLSVYAACKSAGMSFDAFYRHLYPKLEGQVLLNQVFTVLKDDANWKAGSAEGKCRNPINAFSLVYHKILFAGIPGKLGDLRKPAQPSHIKEVCFNASEFTTGLSFRFQCCQEPENPLARGGDFGSDGASLVDKDSWNTIDSIRLADVLASSSCFPGGFEPMRYPADFAHEELPVSALEQALKIEPTIGKPVKTLALMDGGICDNQGLDSLLNAFRRAPLLANRINSKGDAFDLLLVCDVASHYMHPAVFSDPAIPLQIRNKTLDNYWSKLHAWWTKIPLALGLLSWGGLCLVLYLGWYCWQHGMQAPALILGVLSILVMLTAFAAKRAIKKYKNKPGSFVSILHQPDLENILLRLFPGAGFSVELGNQLVNYLRQRPISELSHWVMDRVSSGKTLLGDIFLKQIRRQIYYKLYSDQQTFYRRTYIPIYSLSKTNNKARKNPAFDIQGEEPDSAYAERKKQFRLLLAQHNMYSPEMQKVADLAYSMGTTLWFSPEEEGADTGRNKRKALIACGQFTTAYELFQYALLLEQSRYNDHLSAHYKQVVSDMVLQLKALMEKFRKDPYWLVKEMETVL